MDAKRLRWLAHDILYRLKKWRRDQGRIQVFILGVARLPFIMCAASTMIITPKIIISYKNLQKQRGEEKAHHWHTPAYAPLAHSCIRASGRDTLVLDAKLLECEVKFLGTKPPLRTTLSVRLYVRQL